MLSIFRKGSFGQLFFILLMTALLWFRAFVAPFSEQAVMPAQSFFSPIYDLLFEPLSDLPYLASAIALLVVIIQGIWLNIMLYNHKIGIANSLLPLLLYIVVMSWDPSQLTITPMLLVNFFLIAACGQLLSDGSSSLEVGRNFNASFLLGLAMLCHLPAVCLVLAYLFIFVTYKLYRWRDIIVSLLGLVAPFIIVAIYAFLIDKLFYFSILFRHDITSLHILSQPGSIAETIAYSILLILLAAALLRHLSVSGDSVVHQRINARVLTLPLLSAVAMIFYTRIFPPDTQTLAIPFTFLMTSMLFVERKRQWVNEVLFWLIMIAALL